MEELKASEVSGDKKRPALLTLLCIFTFVCSGFITLFSFLGILFSGWLAETVKEIVPGLDGMSSAFFIVLFLVLFILFSLSLWGAILMFGLRKGGFVLYVIPNGLKLVFLTIGVFSAFNYYSLGFLLFSVALIILYSTQVKHMKG
jgi:hypothetical protein